MMQGTVMRAAQSIGFHRDGDNFRLTPFEAEMRRRIWWHLFSHDARATEDHGITIDVLDHASDIKFPLNINDDDMDPGMTELPPARPGWTDMTLPMCMYRLTQMMLQLQHEITAAPTATTEARRLELVREHTAYVEELQRQCNPVVPLQRATVQMVRLVHIKFDFVSRLQLVTASQGGGGGGGGRGGCGSSSSGRPEGPHSCSRAPHATDESLLGACQIVELSQAIEADELLQSFRWSCEIYVQYHVILYLLWHLCVRPLGASSNTERAWSAVNMAFDSEIARQRRQRVGGGTARANPKWTVLTALRDKALRIREAVLNVPTNTAGTNTYDLDAILPSVPGVSVPAQTAASTSSAVPVTVPDVDVTTDFGDGTDDSNMGWDTSFLDWNVLADDFQANTFDFASSL